MKTYTPKKKDIHEKWFLADAENQILGRFASRLAKRLRGKDLPTFTPHVDPRVFVVVINAEKIKLTGNKWKDKMYYHHTGYPGGIKSTTAEKLMEKKPTEILIHAVKGMLPHNRLGRQLQKHLKVYSGENHPHGGQRPEMLDLHTREVREEE